MADSVMRLGSPQLFFTEPWEPVTSRRGDPLGIRALVDQIAESVAPGFSNRTQDARWVTLLAWSLVRSQAVFRTGFAHAEMDAAAQRQRYNWLRPLELMWVARTITLDEDNWKSRTLPGRRRVSAAVNGGARKMPPRFGLSEAQFQRYRQTGAYGAYRVAFRKWPGLTAAGDGWNPGPASVKLALWLDNKLGSSVRPAWPVDGDTETAAISVRSIRAHSGKEAQWWLANWPGYLQPMRSRIGELRPSRRDEATKLPEADLIEPMIFGQDPAGQRRMKVVRVLARSGAASHHACCEALAGAFKDVPAITLMPDLLALTDAAMDVMDRVAELIRGTTGQTLKKLQADTECKRRLSDLTEASKQWLCLADCGLKHRGRADRLAQAIYDIPAPDRLRSLILHHQLNGGGLRWFILQGDSVVPNAPPTGNSSRYGFRLWALNRIAVQCGVVKSMPKGLMQEAIDLDEDDADDQ